MLVKIEVKGDKAVVNSLKRVNQNYSNAIKSAVRTSGLQVEKAAKINSPVKTGNLRRGILSKESQQGNKYIARVGPDIATAPYAIYVEEGHAQQPGRFVPALGKRLVASWVTGKWYMARTGIQMRKRVENNLKNAFKQIKI